jgi:hypothetical protein
MCHEAIMRRSFGLDPGFIWVAALSLAVGCGGNTNTSNDDAGASTACNGNCSPAQIAAACSVACDKVAKAGCPRTSNADCPANCASLPSMAPPACASAQEAILRCAESAQATCTATGEVQFPACEAADQALIGCLADSGAFGTPPTAYAYDGGPSSGACASVPADVCPSIPRPTGASSCGGFGGAGPNAPAMTTTQCQDRAGNTWQASCTGSTCTCTYNGGSSCMCTMTGPNNTCPCCPGTG